MNNATLPSHSNDHLYTGFSVKILTLWWTCFRGLDTRYFYFLSNSDIFIKDGRRIFLEGRLSPPRHEEPDFISFESSDRHFTCPPPGMNVTSRRAGPSIE